MQCLTNSRILCLDDFWSFLTYLLMNFPKLNNCSLLNYLSTQVKDLVNSKFKGTVSKYINMGTNNNIFLL